MCEKYFFLVSASYDLQGRVFSFKKRTDATRYNKLLYTATHCNILQYSATHCNTLKYSVIRLQSFVLSKVIFMNGLRPNGHILRAKGKTK